MTLTGGVQVLDTDGRWVARVTYTTKGNSLIPLGLEVRLRPPCPGHPGWATTENADTGAISRHHDDDHGVRHTDEEPLYAPPDMPCQCGWPTDPLDSETMEPVPSAGLTLKHLRSVSITRDITRTHDAFRAALSAEALQTVPQANTFRTFAQAVTTLPDRPRGRKRRDRLVVLQVLRAYQRGDKRDDIAAAFGYAPDWVKDALAWARNEGLLVGGRGRGARGGIMSAAAEAELHKLEARSKETTDGER